MPLLHTFCSSPTSITNPQQLSNLPTKPSFPKLHNQIHQLSLPLPLPDLPAHVKQKIISLEIMGVNSGRALCLNPAIRDASLDSIHSIISYLQSKGIHFKDLGRILGMCPKILTSSIRTDLSPVFAFLSNDLGVPDSNFRRVINKCPRLLTSSVRDQLLPSLFYLQRLGFKDLDSLAYQDPVLLVSSVEKTLMPKLEFLMGLGLPREEAVEMVLRCPGLFTFSIERNFKPKYDYFVQEMKGSLMEIKEFPQYFAFSLEKRIKPRHREVVEKGIRMPLSVMLKTTEEEFRELIEKQR
ncbi:transcription termination factor MTEF1, chloroplastic [Typha latifolia]|uniref:transcription termination factor MTEF1, chloroplastic n=1 Tax=Typha latifolia TaxID=4733 RepID=UPI003C2EFD4D